MKSIVVVLALVLGGKALHARVDLLLVPPESAVAAQRGLELTLHLNNPTERDETTHLPRDLVAHYASAAGHGRVRLSLADDRDEACHVPALTRRTIRLRLEESIPGPAGFVSLRLANPDTNAIMFELAPAATSGPDVTPDPAVATPRRPLMPGRHIDLTSDIENMRRHISGYDPIYFAVGWRDRFNARFQFSFKYRLFERGAPGEPWPQQLAREIYVGYTQTSIWDLESFSKPFYDTSYKPTVFVLHEFDHDSTGRWRFSLQGGAQHESNGKSGSSATPSLFSPATARRHPSDTRSVNTLYLAPKLRWTAENDFFVETRLWGSLFFHDDENPDIERYRGHVELTLRTGWDRGFQFSAHGRGSVHGHGSLELNVSWPAIQTPLLKLVLPASLGGYAQIQYFNGYGESLLDYDIRRKDQLRFGLMIVR